MSANSSVVTSVALGASAGFCANTDTLTPGERAYLPPVTGQGRKAEALSFLARLTLKMRMNFYAYLKELQTDADDILVAYSKARMGEPIPLPEDPSRTPDGDIAYEFQGWYGYEPGMVVTGSESFSAWFVGFVADPSGGEVRYGHMYFGNNLDDAVHVSEECAQDLLSRSVREGLGGVVFEFSHGRMTLGNDDLARIVGDGLTIRMGDLYFDDFRYFVEIGGSDGTVHVDVDIPWRTTVSVPSTVVVQGMDGAPAEVEFNNMWLEGKHYVRFTATESVRCDVKGSDLTMDEGAQIVMYTVILLILVACAVVYLNTRNN